MSDSFTGWLDHSEQVLSSALASELTGGRPIIGTSCSRAFTPHRTESYPPCPGLAFSPLSDKSKWVDDTGKVWPDHLMSPLEWSPNREISRLEGGLICGSVVYYQGSHFASLCVESLFFLIDELNHLHLLM